MAATTRQRLEKMLGRVVRGNINTTVFRFRGVEFEIWRFENGPLESPSVYVVLIGNGIHKSQQPVKTYEELAQCCVDLVIRDVMEL